MKELVKVLKLVETDNEISAEIDKDLVRLHVNNDVAEVKEVDGKLDIELKLANFKEVGVDVARLKEIIYFMKKESKLSPQTVDELKRLKQKYLKGTKIRFIQLYEHTALTPNFIAEVDFVDDLGGIHVKLLNDRTTVIVEGLDKFEIIGGDNCD